MAIAADIIASGTGWTVRDVVCDAGPGDPAFEERHADVSIAVVTAGSFQYRTRQGAATLAPGSLLLGNAGACFECGHTHARGDRCLAFHYEPGFFEAVAADVPGVRDAQFTKAALPALPALAPLVAEAEAARDNGDVGALEELALRLAGAVVSRQRGRGAIRRAPTARDEQRVTAALRRIEAAPQAPHGLAALARAAELSPFHFLRTFRHVTGLTPHQFVLRMRLNRAAMLVRRSTAAITDIAYDCGFNDLSTFNRRFRRLMGIPPGAWRKVR
ncbi:MAG: helix-turn-helix transcriptional regulator [Pseudolabrys sp.]